MAKGHRTPNRRFTGRRSAALLLLASIATPAVPETLPIIRAPAVIRATPALWEISDADTKIYLFGTFHSLDGRTVWFDHRVRDAFNGSDELVLETIVPTDRATMLAAGDQASEMGPDGKTFLKPFIAQTKQVVGQGQSLGMSVEHGADSVLRRIAEDSGKPVGGLERFEDQLGQLAKIPVNAQTKTERPAVSLGELLGAWKKGDTGTFSTMLAGFEANSPVAYRMLIADRNARWGQWIVSRLDQPGTVFVAVGSGHLAGKDSVQQWLAARGISSARIG
ncbi:MAG TPA: TraB/GumN family protein [Sphingomicrobium sp.]|nr:TraB/GumN family protein [Sphingomicrobium sp.]